MNLYSFGSVLFVLLLLGGCGDDSPAGDDGGAADSGATDSMSSDGAANDGTLRDATTDGGIPVGSFASGSTCTDGEDCFCDNLEADSRWGASIGVCEDFEHPALYEAGHPLSWYADGEGQPGRGFGNYWHTNYGPSVSGFTWQVGSPEGTPRFGEECTTYCSAGEYCSVEQGNLADGMGADCWQANDFARIDIFREEDSVFGNADVPYPAVFDGTTAYNALVPSGESGGIHGEFDLEGGAKTEFALTQALRFAPNAESSGVMTDAWKFEEFSDSSMLWNGQRMWHLNRNNIERDLWPYGGSVFLMGVCEGDPNVMCTTGTNCINQEAGRVCMPPVEGDFCTTDRFGPNYRPIVGQLRCARADEPAVILESDVSRYEGWDSAYGAGDAYHCFQAYWDADANDDGVMNDGRIMKWHDGTLILHIEGIDLDGTDSEENLGFGQRRWSTMAWNNYANINQGATPSTEDTGRFYDNFVIAQGDASVPHPVPCQQIGFDIPSVCGNFIVEPGEACDDGNTDAGDSCSPTCE